jgi:lipopolysaccharide/colanic/teichoic acid biosynthesis glycosyltransferase
MIKRLFDIIVSLTGIILLSPLMGILAILVWTGDGRPVLFRHQRIGRHGKSFQLFKFRTMTPGRQQAAGSFDPGDTSRVTPVGRMLRRTKLDELPQLFNVIRGDMSMVGPRPEVERWVRAFPERWESVLQVRPGITDNASLRFRNEEAILKGSPAPEETYRSEILPEKLALYEAYVHDRSFFGDLRILFRTCMTVFTKTP